MSDVYTLKNKNGVQVQFMAHGGRLTSIKVPAADGSVADVVIGYDTPDEALAGDLYFGALCGRYANRISKGSFSIDGDTYQLDCNDSGKNHLHGGVNGFHTKVWGVQPAGDNAYTLSLKSEDGEEKYPGEFTVQVTYTLDDENALTIAYEAQTTKPTVVNLTSHPYFNLKGAGSGDVLEHTLEIMADQYTPISAELGTCSGEIASVAGTPFDFSSPKPLKDAVSSDDEQIQLGGGGVDHNFVLQGTAGEVRLAARLNDPDSGRVMEVYTDQPGLQIYTGNHFDGSEKGKQGNGIVKCAGVALEAQVYPDSPNKDNFPNAVLRPGETYTHTCVYKFV